MPSKNPLSTLIPDILELFRGGHTCSKELLREYGERVAESLSSSLSQGDHHEARLRLSGIGKPSRRLFYELTDAPKERLEPKVFFKFQYGHILEEMFLVLAKEAGHEISQEQMEVTFEGVKGHIDAIIDGVLVDVKSASPFGFLKFKDGSIRQNDSFNYIPQLASYYQALELTNGAAFVAIEKVSGDMCVCYLTHEELMEVDVKGHVKRQKTVQDRAKGEALAKVPVRCFPDKEEGKSGNRSLVTQCSYCPFKFYCWRDANDGEGLRTFLYSNGPKFLTQVQRLPKVFEGAPPELYQQSMKE